MCVGINDSLISLVWILVWIFGVKLVLLIAAVSWLLCNVCMYFVGYCCVDVFLGNDFVIVCNLFWWCFVSL